jgi:uncharacterized protein (TIGR02145 family)
MKKPFYLLALLLTASFFLNSCAGDDDVDLSVTDVGVMIGGARWATRNVCMPGTFADTPECPGMFFQWNRRQGWAYKNAAGTEWERTNDPCPPGWRVPTYAELRNLSLAAGSRWYAENGVEGRFFGRAPNQIFLPAVGTTPELIFDDVSWEVAGFYWSSTPIETYYARLLSFNNRGSGISTFPRWFGLSVRCVMK